jgi:hypothetical protein
VPGVWNHVGRGDADRRVYIFPRVSSLRHLAATQEGRLLCVLFVRVRRVPTDAVATIMLCGASPSTKISSSLAAILGTLGDRSEGASILFRLAILLIRKFTRPSSNPSLVTWVPEKKVRKREPYQLTHNAGVEGSIPYLSTIPFK